MTRRKTTKRKSNGLSARIDDRFEKKILKRGAEASNEKVVKERERLTPRKRLVKLIANAVQRELKKRDDVCAVSVSEEQLLATVEGVAKQLCRELGLEIQS